MAMFDQLVHKVAEALSQVKDHRKTKPEYGLKDSLMSGFATVSYTHLRAHETPEHLVCRLLLEKKKK